jgi:hypothetical protein
MERPLEGTYRGRKIYTTHAPGGGIRKFPWIFDCIEHHVETSCLQFSCRCLMCWSIMICQRGLHWTYIGLWKPWNSLLLHGSWSYTLHDAGHLKSIHLIQDPYVWSYNNFWLWKDIGNGDQGVRSRNSSQRHWCTSSSSLPLCDKLKWLSSTKHTHRSITTLSSTLGWTAEL